MSLFHNLGNLDPRSQAWYEASLQNDAMRQNLAAQAHAARSGALGGVLGGGGSLLGGLSDRPAVAQYRYPDSTPEPVAKIGKVTPKPGYVYEPWELEKIRLKRFSDYHWWQKPAVAWKVFKLWLTV